jgi:hypothetical protein
MINTQLFAGGPYLTPTFLLFLLAGFTFCVFGAALLVISIRYFARKQLALALTCAVFGLLFLYPLVGSFNDSGQIEIYYAVVAAFGLIPLVYFAMRHR